MILYSQQMKFLQDLRCFHNRTTFEEDILGVPLRFFDRYVIIIIIIIIMVDLQCCVLLGIHN